jgi:type IV secretory pathway VirB10-like protein
MAQPEEDKNTHIIDGEENNKPKSSSGIFIIGGILAIAAIAGFVIMSSVGGNDKKHQLTADDIKQLEYDAKQNERDRQKTEQLSDAPFIMREDQLRESERAPLFKDLALAKTFSPPADDKRIQKEEEAIASILRSAPPKTSQAKVSAPPQSSANISPSSAPPPMFVYSRGYGGAKFVDSKPETQTAEKNDLTRAMTAILSSATAQDEDDNLLPQAAEKTKLVYSGLTPVTVHEGELLEAVLVNRLIVDTEPSPVICHLSRDLFDRSGQYVIFPANSRIIGTSQAITYKGAARLFISFHRLILPNGLSVDLPQSRAMMKAMDETGALGVVSNVNRHWMLQFGTAVMLGVLDGIAGYAQRDQATITAEGAVISRTSENFDRVLDRVMSQYSSIVPTIRVDQGKTLRIYIADDMLISPYARVTERSYYAR